MRFLGWRPRSRYGFTVGDRVEMTEAFRATFIRKIRPGSERGVVVGVGQVVHSATRLVWVQRDGQKSKASYATVFWRKI